MADQSDVETSLVQSVTGALYPNGQGDLSVTGSPIRVYRGWPQSGPLEKDLSLSVSNVSVYSIPNDSRTTTRWCPETSVCPGAITLQVQVNGISISFIGQAGVGQVAGLIVDDQAFVYKASADDTPTLVAAILARDISAVRPCSVSGTTLTVPGAKRLAGRVVADGLASSELMRQEQGFRISAWCPNPFIRDRVCSSLMSSFSSIAFIALPDGSAGRVRYRSTASFDDNQDASQYRRDLIYDVEYGTFVHASLPAMLFGDLTWTGATTLV